MDTETFRTRAKYLIVISEDNNFDVKRKKRFYGFNLPSLNIILDKNLLLEIKLPIISLYQYKCTLYLFRAKGNINIFETKDDPFKVREPDHTWEFNDDFENDGESILILILEEDPNWILPETLNPIKHRAIIRQHQAISYYIEYDVASLISRAFLIEAKDFKIIDSILSKNAKNHLTKKIKYIINNTIKYYLDYVIEKNQKNI